MDGLQTLGLTRREHSFLLLVRAGLWNREPKDLQGFPLSAGDWEAVMQQAREQTVQGLLLSGIQQLPPELLPAHQQLWQWMPELAGIEAGYQQTLAAVATSNAILRATGAEPLLQKGISVARFYDQPQWRVNGDVDWYVGCSSLKSITEYLQKQGYLLQHHADGSISLNLDEVEVELHPYPTDILTPRAKKLLQELFTLGERQQMHLPNGQTIDVASPIGTLLMLEAHLMKHVFTVGIGLRQFCDMARAAHVLYGKYDNAQLTQLLRSTGMMRWHLLLQRFLESVLGMATDIWPQTGQSPYKKMDDDLRWLLHDVLRGGNFGQHTSAWKSQEEQGKGFTGHTLRQILNRLPHALHIAPTEVCYQTGSLAYHRIQNKIHKST